MGRKPGQSYYNNNNNTVFRIVNGRKAITARPPTKAKLAGAPAKTKAKAS